VNGETELRGRELADPDERQHHEALDQVTQEQDLGEPAGGGRGRRRNETDETGRTGDEDSADRDDALDALDFVVGRGNPQAARVYREHPQTLELARGAQRAP
jgi:hypothetical protein